MLKSVKKEGKSLSIATEQIQRGWLVHFYE